MDEQGQINLLKQLYRDKNSGLFLLKDTEKLYQNAKNHARLANVSRETIKKFKATIESLSRTKAEKILRGNKRRYSFRKYIFYGPNQILLGKYCYCLTTIKNNRKKNNTTYLITPSPRRFVFCATADKEQKNQRESFGRFPRRFFKVTKPTTYNHIQLSRNSN